MCLILYKFFKSDLYWGAGVSLGTSNSEQKCSFSSLMSHCWSFSHSFLPMLSLTGLILTLPVSFWSILGSLKLFPTFSDGSVTDSEIKWQQIDPQEKRNRNLLHVYVIYKTQRMIRWLKYVALEWKLGASGGRCLSVSHGMLRREMPWKGFLAVQVKSQVISELFSKE